MVVRLSPSFREGSDVREQEAPNTTAISIHAPAKGATVAGSPQTLISSFQSTLPRRERPQLIREVNVPNTFQSTLPRRERRSRRFSDRPAGRDFNPRSREGSDAVDDIKHCRRSNFNPRSREGSDTPVAACLQAPAELISIHAPAKGATYPARCAAGAPCHFNPRSREGSDRLRKTVLDTVAGFQSTLPRRERRSKSCTAIRKSSKFQSTLPRRERQQKSPRLFPMIFTK